ncbi:MAG: helix-turn-helix domain-containing protein [Nitrospirota bacterium]|nr:helix-turn-helix domain-containing protein [Nitrospirota bacterium]
MTDRSSPYREQEFQALLGDVLALSALPTLLLGNEPSTIARTLANVLFDMLHVELVYVCLTDETNGSPAEEVRVEDQAYSAGQALDLGRMILSQRTPYSVTSERNRNDAHNIRQAVAPIGLEGKWGMVLGASQQSGFPTEFDSLRLRLAANQAISAIQAGRAWSSTSATHGIGPAVPAGQGASELAQPEHSGDHWHADFLQMTARGIQIHGTVMPARGVTSRYRMTATELKACLKQLDWTQKKLANAFHVSQSTVKKWAQGRAKIPGPAIVLIKLMLENSAYLHRHPIRSLPMAVQ